VLRELSRRHTVQATRRTADELERAVRDAIDRQTGRNRSPRDHLPSRGSAGALGFASRRSSVGTLGGWEDRPISHNVPACPRRMKNDQVTTLDCLIWRHAPRPKCAKCRRPIALGYGTGEKNRAVQMRHENAIYRLGKPQARASEPRHSVMLGG
jgi:hypothetical protein